VNLGQSADAVLGGAPAVVRSVFCVTAPHRIRFTAVSSRKSTSGSACFNPLNSLTLRVNVIQIDCESESRIGRNSDSAVRSYLDLGLNQITGQVTRARRNVAWEQESPQTR